MLQFAASAASTDLGSATTSSLSTDVPSLNASVSPELDTMTDRHTNAEWAAQIAETQKKVAVRQDNILALCFHPELTKDLRLHRLFLKTAAPVTS